MAERNPGLTLAVDFDFQPAIESLTKFVEQLRQANAGAGSRVWIDISDVKYALTATLGREATRREVMDFMLAVVEKRSTARVGAQMCACGHPYNKHAAHSQACLDSTCICEAFDKKIEENI
jgi:hypothetical protein